VWADPFAFAALPSPALAPARRPARWSPTETSSPPTLGDFFGQEGPANRV